MKKTRSLKQQITFIYLSTTLIVALVVSIYLFSKTRDYTRNTLENSYRSSADMLFSKMDAKIDNFCSYAYMLSRNPSLINMLLNPYDIYDTVVALNADIEPTIQFILGSSDTIENITIYTDESKHNIPSNYFSDVDDIRNTNWFKQASKLDGAFLTSEQGELFVVCPIRNYHSLKIDTGFVRLDIDIDKFAEEIDSSHDELYFSLNDENGKQLFSTINHKDFDKYLQLNENTLHGTQITSSFYVSKSLLKLPVMEMLFPILIILAVFLCFSYAYMHFINKIMFLRIERIMEQINLIDADNFHVDIADNHNDEIGKLAKCISAMSQKINNLFVQLVESKDKEKRAELELLRAKIDPHFLYNIMDTINWMAIDGNTELISEITHELSVFYRTNLNYGETITTVFNEIENVKAYLNLQMIATSQGFDVKYEIDEQLLNCKTCDFILQPLAENAIVHGIKPLKTRRGLITLKLYEQGNNIYLIIEDNGVGIHNNTSTRLGFKKTNYGLKNINERIKLTFGSDYGVTLKQIPNRSGTSAEIKLPKE